jgi:CDP-diacylglycerol--glycerol-3-phosphate 3-phosphatidyltransferase
MLLQSPDLRRRLPNAITIARLALAGIFFGMLLLYHHGNVGNAWWLFAAGWVYGLAAATDWLDGYLARKWAVTSVFGRIVDPFCDKILVLGTFIFFASAVFVVPDPAATGGVRSLTGVGPVIVVLLLGRELLVTTIRGMFESTGQAFGAKWGGKQKMTFQSIAIPVVLFYVFMLAVLERGDTFEIALRIVRDVAVWGTVIVTLWSGIEYLPRRQNGTPPEHGSDGFRGAAD